MNGMESKLLLLTLVVGLISLQYPENFRNKPLHGKNLKRRDTMFSG